VQIQQHELEMKRVLIGSTNGHKTCLLVLGLDSLQTAAQERVLTLAIDLGDNILS